MIINYLLLTITIINLAIVILISNLLIRMADVVKTLNKNIDEYFYLINSNSKNNNKNEKGLVEV